MRTLLFKLTMIWQMPSLLLKCVAAVLAIIVSLSMPASASATEIAKPFRAFHIVLLGISSDDAKHLVDMAAAEKFNFLVLNILWGASVKLKTFPWKVKTKPWEPEELLDVVSYARAKGLEVVPQMPLLSHQNVLLGKYRPDLMYNKSTYNPEKQDVYKIIFPMIDEIVALMKPKAFHVGHDEVVGWKLSHYGRFLGLLERALPVDLFVKDISTIYQHLKEIGVETWMWGDMLITPDEFPEMHSAGLHGNSKGYGQMLRRQIPKDIVICDWHYFDDQADYPSLTVLQKEGFRVIGATWEKEDTIRNFSSYAAKHGAYGMMATTWFHVQRKEWDVVEEIIKVSGEAFLKDFPDAK